MKVRPNSTPKYIPNQNKKEKMHSDQPQLSTAQQQGNPAPPPPLPPLLPQIL